MNPKSVHKAHSRLRIAQKAYVELQKSESYDDFSDTWYTFLTAAKNVYTSLEQGAKDSPQCRQWFGGIKAQRRSDELLQYLFQARDDEEHGIGFGTRKLPGSFVLGSFKPGFSQSFTIKSFKYDPNLGYEVDARSNDGKPILFEFTPFRVALRPVTGRGKISYDPPKNHLGKFLPDNSPLTVAKLAIAYLADLVSEAEERS